MLFYAIAICRIQASTPQILNSNLLCSVTHYAILLCIVMIKRSVYEAWRARAPPFPVALSVLGLRVFDDMSN